MTRPSRSRTVMMVFTVAAMVALGTVARTAPQGRHSVAIGAPCPLDSTLTCVMTGLDSPRGLAFGPEGALYVAEAGAGAGVGERCADDGQELGEQVRPPVPCSW